MIGAARAIVPLDDIAASCGDLVGFVVLVATVLAAGVAIYGPAYWAISRAERRAASRGGNGGGRDGRPN